ncbi:murein biosynthesis integral membrane protein MurJ [Aeromicrobium sp. CTD01-1L150]|uniref:murein biosynthesis integral membrane protein MurJ n=1 Tax=Aeromicrobium sp. CTD01-1L150 TaxID=3341830 RepID=UPI0035BFC263
MSDVARASVWMALGTIVSRVTGFGRLLLLAATIGTALNADLFNIANTIPNAMYILVAGGIFNVVLVPQLVRAMKRDEDGGDAYAHRILTLGLLALLASTILLTLLIPVIMRVVFASRLFEPGFEAQRESAMLLMLLCMPQVFFYGAFVLIGQVLNARRHFGPMMWAPVVNNAVSCAVLGLYLVVFGASNGTDGFSTSQALLLGLGSTAAIAAQTVVLWPFLRRSGFRVRLRFDFRGSGLGHTLRLGAWTLGFIIANQVAFIVIQRLGNRGTTEGAASSVQAAGTAVYEIGFLVSQMPHGVITVSIATAVIPTLSTLAADREYRRMTLELSRTLRIALTIIAPLAIAVACLGPAAATVLGFVPNLRGDTQVIGWTVAAFAPAMIAFCLHFVMLRGFYANEDTRTPFFIQVVIACTNIVAAVVLTSLVEPGRVAQMLALAYGIAYLLGAGLSAFFLSRSIGTIVDAQMLRFAARLTVAVGIAAGTMLAGVWALGGAGVDVAEPGGALMALLTAGAAGALAFIGTAVALRLQELRYVVTSVLRRG